MIPDGTAVDSVTELVKELEPGNHRDDADAVRIDWTSVDAAKRGGRLVAQYAQEWVAFLEANNCDYQSVVCRPPDQ